MKKWITYFVTMFIVGITAQNSVVDSLKNELAKAKHDTSRCRVLEKLCEVAAEDEWPTYNTQMQKLAMQRLKNKSLLPSEKKLFMRFCATSFNNDGYLWSLRGNEAKALECYNTSLKIGESINDFYGVSLTLVNIGSSYQNLGDYTQALDSYDKAISIMNKRGDKFSVATPLNNMALIYQNQGDNKLALTYFKRCMEIQKLSGDEIGLSNALHNIGLIYQSASEYSKALDYYTQSLEIRKKLNYKRGIAMLYNNMGGIFSSQKNYSKALEYLNLSVNLANELGHKEDVAITLGQIGNLYFVQKDYDKAFNYCTLALQLSKEIGHPASISSNAMKMYKVSKAMGSYKLAMENFEIFVQMRDSINNETNKKASIKSQLKYEYEKKAAADSVKVAEEKKVVQAQLKQEQTQRYSLYGGLALVLIFALFMVNRFRVTNKQKKLIEEQKKVVEEQKHIVEMKQSEILDSIYYARRIQRALITSEKYINRNLKNLNG